MSKSIDDIEKELGNAQPDEEKEIKGAENYKPWNDQGNRFKDKAQERLKELPVEIREKVTQFNLDIEADKVLQMIPVETKGKSKYNRIIAQQIYDIVSKTGQYKFVFDEYELIAKQTLFNWQYRYPEFKFLMIKAKENFRKRQWEVNPDIEQAAIEELRKAVKGERVKKQVIYSQDQEGNTYKKVIKTEKPSAKWAIEKVLGDETNDAEGGGENQVTELTLEE